MGNDLEGRGRQAEGGGGWRKASGRTDGRTDARADFPNARARARDTHHGPGPRAVVRHHARSRSVLHAFRLARGRIVISPGRLDGVEARGACAGLVPHRLAASADNILSLFVIPAKDRTHVGMTNNDRKIAYKRAGAPATGVGRTALVLGSPPGHKAQITTTLIVYIIVYIF